MNIRSIIFIIKHIYLLSRIRHTVIDLVGLALGQLVSICDVRLTTTVFRSVQKICFTEFLAGFFSTDK